MPLPENNPEVLSGNKIIRTFRMPRELVHTLGREAALRGLDLTALVLRILQGYIGYFALPEAAIAQLEADRAALRMDRHQYLAHLLYHRCLALQEQGPGFDDPRGARKAPAAAPAETPPLAKPLGSAGGGAHHVSDELLPGAGLWPIGVEKKP
jgi:hypothetical protein